MADDNDNDDSSEENSNNENQNLLESPSTEHLESHELQVPPYFPKEFWETMEDHLSYDFNRRFFDIPTTINHDLLTDEQLSQPISLETFQQVEDLISEFLTHFKPKSDTEIESSEEDQIDKKELFLKSGKSIKK